MGGLPGFRATATPEEEFASSISLAGVLGFVTEFNENAQIFNDTVAFARGDNIDAAGGRCCNVPAWRKNRRKPSFAKS